MRWHAPISLFPPLAPPVGSLPPSLVRNSLSPIPFQPRPALTATTADVMIEQLRQTKEAISNLQRQHDSLFQSFKLDHGARVAVSSTITQAPCLLSVPQPAPALAANEEVVTNIPQAEVGVKSNTASSLNPDIQMDLCQDSDLDNTLSDAYTVHAKDAVTSTITKSDFRDHLLSPMNATQTNPTAVCQSILPAKSSGHPNVDVPTQHEGEANVGVATQHEGDAKVAVTKIIPPADPSTSHDTITPSHSSVHLDMDVTNQRDGQAKVASDSNSESTAEPQPFKHTASFIKQQLKHRKNCERAYSSERTDVTKAIMNSLKDGPDNEDVTETPPFYWSDDCKNTKKHWISHETLVTTGFVEVGTNEVDVTIIPPVLTPLVKVVTN